MQTEMKIYYAERASYYDAVYEKPERKNDIEFLRDFLPQRLAGRTVLEIACGTGYWSQYIAPACQHYVATDGVAEPLAIAKQRLQGNSVHFSVADVYALPTSLGQFDGAFAGLWFSHVPVERRSEFFASLHSLLTPGARVALLDNSEAQLTDFPIAERDGAGNTFQHRPLRDGSVHRVLKNFPTENDMLAQVKAFSGVNCQFRQLDNFWFFEYELPISR